MLLGPSSGSHETPAAVNPGSALLAAFIRWVTLERGSGLPARVSNHKGRTMVKVNGPMFSLDASGTLADAITFSKWKGRPYVRERVIPSNPKSGAQTGRRAMFRFLSQAWNDVGTSEKATWLPLAEQIIASNFNAYLKDNMERWHNFLAPTDEYPVPSTGTPSDNALTACVWEENRVKLSIAGTTLGDNWGIAIFASLNTMSGAPTVGQAVLIQRDVTIAAHDEYWTPPTVDTYYFDTITFSDAGVKAAVGGEDTAVP